MRYPDLSDSKIISFDIETKDPELLKKGSGVYRKDGHILGVSIANEQGFAEYYNVGHLDCSYETKQKNLAYIRDVLATPVQKLAVNAKYDLDWLMNGYNIPVNGTWNDIQIAEPLLDEYAKSYSLDALAQKYLGKGKEKNEIDQWCEDKKLKGDARKHLWKMPYALVKKYAIADATLPIDIFRKQKEQLKEQDLIKLYRMEMDLFPLLLQMRRTGVLIDTKKLDVYKGHIQEEMQILQKKLRNNYGEFNHNSAKQIQEVFDILKIDYPLTEKGNPSFAAGSLKKCGHSIARDILELRHKEKIFGTFLENYFTGHAVNGRIHCEFNSLRGDKYGTISGRFSSSNPNLQNIPKQNEDDEIATMCRSVFVPEQGCWWGSIDYSQIEYRFIAHYAEGPKSTDIKEQYNNDPTTDYHKVIEEMTGTPRKKAKTLNFGIGYGMGVSKLAIAMGTNDEEAKELRDNYHRMAPFVKFTQRKISNVVRRRGYIRTILNRRARMTEKQREEGKEYTFFNRLMQGSAADLMKKAMVDCYKAGIFETLALHITVHDELDVSVPKTKQGVEAFCEMKNLMENALTLEVPIRAEAELGDSWASANKENFREIKKEYSIW